MTLKVKKLMIEIGNFFRKYGFKIYEIDEDLSIMQMGSGKQINPNEVAKLMLDAFDSLDFKMDINIKYLNPRRCLMTINQEVNTRIDITMGEKRLFRRCLMKLKFTQLGKDGKLIE